MKKEDMVVGKVYVHKSLRFTELYVFVRHGVTGWGNFVNLVSAIDYVFALSNMTEAPAAKPEFKIDNEIEVSFNSSFDDRSGTFKGKFKHLDPSGSYWVVDKDGFMRCGDFARKVKPMVTGYINRRQYSATKEMWKVFDDAAEKIIAGDYNA